MSDPFPLPVPTGTSLDFEDEANWILVYTGSLIANIVDLNRGIYEPMSEQVLSSSFSSPILKIRIVTTNNNSRYAGKIKQFYDTGTTGLAYRSTRKIWIGTQIVRFAQDINNDYVLKILPDQWKSNLVINIYEYQK